MQKIKLGGLGKKMEKARTQRKIEELVVRRIIPRGRSCTDSQTVQPRKRFATK